MSIHTTILFYCTLLLALQPVSSRAESCAETAQSIDNQHRKTLDSYKAGSDDYLNALSAIEDGVFPALERCPRNAPLMTVMSEIQLSLGQPSLALLYAQKALEYAPNHWQAHSAAGNALNVAGKFAEGLQHLQRASTLQPDNYALLVNLCSSYERNQHPDKAIQSCSRVIDKGPYDLRGTAYFLRAKAHRARGELEQAESDDRHAKEFGFRGQTGINK